MPERNTLLPRPDRSVMQPPPVPPSGLAMDRPRQPHVVCVMLSYNYYMFFHKSS